MALEFAWPFKYALLCPVRPVSDQPAQGKPNAGRPPSRTHPKERQGTASLHLLHRLRMTLQRTHIGPATASEMAM